MTAVQVTLAAGIAMGFGLALSRERWFWAVISAFLVFVNTRSRGDTAVRATQRALGTLFGIFVGLGIGLLIGDWKIPTALLALSSLFFAFYSLPVSYARMTFFISAALALVYALMGVLTVELAWLRVEETVIGTLAGMLVSATVFPTRSRVPLEAAVAGYYAALRALLEALGGRAAPAATMRRLAQDLDQAYGGLVDAARPIGTPWQVVTRPGKVRQTLSLFLATTYWARLAARQGPLNDGAPDAMTTDKLLARLDDLQARKAECFYIDRDRSASAPLRGVSSFPRAPDDTLSALDATMARLYPEDR
nr:FUSC family protein [Rhizobium halophytocola]